MPRDRSGSTARAPPATTTFAARKISSGYSWPECPCWHEGTFWFQDMYTEP
ncbi:hypothetical protein NFA_33990 [Nocardia farcinica IFM 10152]|uniref:Uncharacterized protein n=1 Tax=Nocardia farcinica (strain IFM 10152) TaxID=247156 RepID=Q5YU95_NOCFA|nr:hypothetical protein NFA_33990 [Nocardia farcinica IFM 10152]